MITDNDILCTSVAQRSMVSGAMHDACMALIARTNKRLYQMRVDLSSRDGLAQISEKETVSDPLLDMDEISKSSRHRSSPSPQASATRRQLIDTARLHDRARWQQSRRRRSVRGATTCCRSC
jgi:hypothetical protein